MIERMKKLFKDEEGATMVEYALLVALIALVVIIAAAFLGTKISDKFQEAGEKVENAPNP